MNGQMEVKYEGRDRLQIQIRGHELLADQPLEVGGDDLGPSPTELFVASLVACVGFYAERYLRRHDLPTEGLRVIAAFAMGHTPARVESIDVRLEVPEGIPEKRVETLLAVVEGCTVHNSLRHPPKVAIEIRTAALASAVGR